jgi:hypothetical protein
VVVPLGAPTWKTLGLLSTKRKARKEIKMIKPIIKTTLSPEDPPE